jgi:hypothetical protein
LITKDGGGQLSAASDYIFPDGNYLTAQTSAVTECGSKVKVKDLPEALTADSRVMT